MKTVKIGIIICDRYRNCGGGKCFRALQNREGAFDIYAKEDQVEIVGYANCGGCPGGNIEYVPEEMKKNGAEVIHLATGLVVGYPPLSIYKAFSGYDSSEVRYESNCWNSSNPAKILCHTFHSWNMGNPGAFRFY